MIEVVLNVDERTATVIVQGDQLSLAIGRGGQNVRLAARLTGWKVNIQEFRPPETEVSNVESQTSNGDSEVSNVESQTSNGEADASTPEA